MPATLSYPGVYIQEIPSGVRTITGVSTSVTAFVGPAKRGSINKAVRVQSYSDYERRFGGLACDSLMSYAVSQYFQNEGNEAWIVRLAHNTSAASLKLYSSAEVSESNEVLELTALEEGYCGNAIEVGVDYCTENSASTFNLTLTYAPTDNPSDRRTEEFKNISMNSLSPRYVEKIVTSNLVKVKRNEALKPTTLGNGTSTSRELVDENEELIDVLKLIDEKHDQFKISVNGAPAITIQITKGMLGIINENREKNLSNLCKAIQTKVLQFPSKSPSFDNFQCISVGNCIVMTSGVPGENSSVQVLPGDKNDLSKNLRLGLHNKGTEIEAASAWRPIEIPAHGTLQSGIIDNPDLTDIEMKFFISLDSGNPVEVTIDNFTCQNNTITSDELVSLANTIQTTIQNMRKADPAFSGFTAFKKTSDDGEYLILCSGTRGAGSSVVVSSSNNSIANKLNLINNVSSSIGKNVYLEYGKDDPIPETEEYNIYIPDRSKRKGIYALESIDLFNILCLPGISNTNILTDAIAYCKERRAFMIIDAPEKIETSEEMADAVNGIALPKSDHAAVYFPWIKVPDPLNSGNLRSIPPCGTIAGLYARTDCNRGVWKAPAGTDANLSGVRAINYPLTQRENGVLNPLGINCIMAKPGYGIVAWGARTLCGNDNMNSEYKYIPVRRLALYIEESLFRGTQWVVFEPNDEPLWAQIRLNIGSFMHSLFRQHAFQGMSAKDAYFVKCDKETTTQDDINRGIVNILVGFAPLKPAEFVIINVQQMAGQIQT
jgi:phage tail sheath protein FI